jgi:two-component system CheB/CheR fusion protein
LYVNAAVEPATGLSSQAFIGKTHRELGIPEDLCIYWEENLRQVFITGQERTLDFDFPTTDGTTRNYQSRIVPEFAPDGSVESILGVARDVTDFKQTEAALRESEQRFRQVTENIDAVFWIFSLDEQKPLYISPAYEKIWGRSSQPLYENSENWMETIHPEDRAYVATMYEQLNQGEFIEYVYRIVKLDGSVRWISDCAFPVYDTHGRLYRTAGIAQDITERKRAEEQLKASLQEKGVLLREVHHRVKNNLQIISSLLDLQAEQIKDAIAKSTTPKAIALEAFRASQNRVKSIALIHEKLYQSENLARVNLADYIHTLATHLLQTYPINPNTITLQLKVDEIFLNLDTVIPCGLIINELVSNALKHGFPDNTKGTLWIHLKSISCVDVESHKEKSEQFTLIIGNNGIHLQDPENLYKAKSLGFQLVNILVKQIQGQIEVTQNQGTEFKIKFSDLDNSAK